ncbi:MAG TPA: ATP-binding protein, partial [Stellaceae bacterium]|nr:ATP-binding protein [Stellaceae bacterium]
LDRLLAAGVSDVALDIDFSSDSTPGDDAALAAALSHAGGRVILPAFVQLGTRSDRSMILTSTYPTQQFRDKARIGAVNVFPETDSLVRRFAADVMFDGVALPTSPILLSGHAAPKQDSFYIDFGIRLESLPILSYVDVLKGRFDPSFLAGKKVLVGASAVELGDQFAVPLHRTLAGPLLQALAYESVSQDRTLRRTGSIPSLVMAALVLVIWRILIARLSWRRRAAALSVIISALYAGSLVIQATQPVSTDIALPLAVAFSLFALGVFLELEKRARDAVLSRRSEIRRRAMMQGVLEDSFDGIIIARPDGMIALANPAAGRLLGRQPQDMTGKPVDQFLPGSSVWHKQLDRPTLEEIDSVDSHVLSDVEVPRPDGSVMTVEHVISSSRLRAGGGQMFIHTFRDTSERKEAEDKLRAAMQEAITANRTKTEFLANMSHELRTPLNAIIGFADIIQGETFGKLPNSRYRDYAGDIAQSGRHLLEIINDILDVSKIETGNVRLHDEPVDLGELVVKCSKLARVRPTGDSNRVLTVVAPDLPLLRADAKLLKQIALNLLSNAIKFTPATGLVTIAAALESGQVVLRVSDTGIGIARDDLAKVTKPFFQIDSGLARKHDGAGLGLALVAAFAKLHGATLEIDSVVGKGT